ncbi:type VI secretion system-associated protein TagF [Xanthobacter agilis]|uniref:Type VI secretion system protein ImpM n=1 Tax=Xanthobacter agilis TaxID=47492 RepID=A0ABU0LEP9_XANAG|nr:type VI secretion system-associated protein TagF [Xanthobacter agilis]MDQ0505583.1 type VI secretion system protein ImpM [Xanthobacter agilis]
MTAAGRAQGGLYGKIPSKDDFVRRNLPLSFVTPWDGWLNRVMAGSAEPGSGAWKAAYLTSPPWRFALDPGVAGPEGWIGVLASSLDRFGRAFPLTLAVPFARDFGILDLHEETRPLTSGLEDLVLEVIDGTLDLEQAAAALVSLAGRLLPAPHPDPVTRTAREGATRADRTWVLTGRRLPTVAGAASELLTWSLRAGAAGPVGLSCWWHEGWDEHPPVWLMTRGLPAPDVFARMMDGAWSAIAPPGEVIRHER